MKTTIIDDGSPEVRARIELALDEQWAEVAEEILERRRMRHGDLLDTDWSLLCYISCRNARRRRELGITGGTWPQIGGAA